MIKNINYSAKLVTQWMESDITVKNVNFTQTVHRQNLEQNVFDHFGENRLKTDHFYFNNFRCPRRGALKILCQEPAAAAAAGPRQSSVIVRPTIRPNFSPIIVTLSPNILQIVSQIMLKIVSQEVKTNIPMVGIVTVQVVTTIG